MSKLTNYVKTDITVKNGNKTSLQNAWRPHLNSQISMENCSKHW